MDLGIDCSALESVENNEVIVTPQRLADVDANKIVNNGSCGGEFYGHDDYTLVDSKPKDAAVAESPNSPLSTSNSPQPTRNSLSVGSSPQAVKKGNGLKKWRRIKRDFSKDGSSNEDTSKILKRCLSTSIVNLINPGDMSVETRQKSNGSSSSTNAVMKSMDVVDGSALHSSSLDFRLVGLSFAAGTDSDNSEDLSSKSSTAASVPKNRMRTYSRKNLVNSVQGDQQGKSQIETSKKQRGGRVKVEKENSHSSMESDSRSSNFLFMQGTTPATSNERHKGWSINYDVVNSHGAEDGEQHFDEELQTGCCKENLGGFETLFHEDLAADLSWDIEEEKVENHRLSTDPDPLVESINTLQSAQEGLEREVEKLKEIGMEPHVSRASYLLHSGDITQNSTQVVSLKQKINLLESKLDEANSELKVKEAKVIQLECVLMCNESPRDEIEGEFECLFKQKIEAEIEYLAISTTIQKLTVAAVDQFAVFEEQKTLASEQAQVLNELGDVGIKAAMLKSQAEKLETKYEDVVATEEVLKLQNSVCQVTTFLFMQLVILVVFFLLQLSSHYEGVVPT